MHGKKRNFRAIWIACLGVLTIAAEPVAAQSMSLSASVATASVGGQVTITVNANTGGVPRIGGAAVVSFDEAVFDLVSGVSGVVKSPGSPFDLNPPVLYTPGTGRIEISMLAPSFVPVNHSGAVASFQLQGKALSTQSAIQLVPPSAWAGPPDPAPSLSGTQVSVVSGSTLTVAPDTQNVAATAGTTTFSVTTPGAWTAASNQGWATVSPASGTGNSTVTVTYTANNGSVARSANITVTATGASGSPRTVTVNQAAPASLAVSPGSRTVTFAAGTTTFSVATPGAWTAASNQGWATVSPASGTGNGTVTVTYAANTGAARSATITVTAPGATGSARTVTVNQGADETSCNRTLAAPTGVVSGRVTGENVIYVSWDAVPTATGYRIYRSSAWQTQPTSDFSQAVQIASTTGTSFFDYSVMGGYYGGCFGFGILSCGNRWIGPPYTYWVVAVDDACNIVGPPSEGVEGSSWKEETGGNSADAGVLVTMILALVLASRFYHKRLRA